MKSATVVLTLVLACSMTGSSDAAQLHATFDLNVTDEGFVSLAREGQLVLPQFRLYDAHQRQVMDIGIGFSPEQFEADLRQALKHPSPIENARTLEQETQTLVQPHGSPLPPFPSPSMPPSPPTPTSSRMGTSIFGGRDSPTSL